MIFLHINKYILKCIIKYNSKYISQYVFTIILFIYISALGTVPSPFDCFLVNRGLKTLHLRMERHMENAQKVSEFLESHKYVERVIYPGTSQVFMKRYLQ